MTEIMFQPKCLRIVLLHVVGSLFEELILIRETRHSYLRKSEILCTALLELRKKQILVCRRMSHRTQLVKLQLLLGNIFSPKKLVILLEFQFVIIFKFLLLNVEPLQLVIEFLRKFCSTLLILQKMSSC